MGSWLLIDCALRTTAVLVEQTESGHRIVAKGEARTTVETEGDVTLGVIAAVRQVEESCGRALFKSGAGVLRRKAAGGAGVDHVLVTSSVGGGLQMMVAGLVRIMTAESAERAALGAGATVLDVMAIDDGRMPHERIERIRQLRPDMFLLSGGVDKGNQSDVLEFAREIAQANLAETPVVYAGNEAARERVREILGGRCQLSVVQNVRPVLEDEVLEPTRQRIQELFMQHVVSKAPGFSELAAWADRPIVPSTGASSRLIELIGQLSKQNVLGVTVGDATTDVFSMFGGRFTRTVSADLGLGHSIANVAVRAGQERLARSVPAAGDQVMNRLYNLMLQPTEQPTDAVDQALQQAAAREAIRLAVEEHRARATGLRGVHQERDISNIFDQSSTGQSIVKPLELDLVIASAAVFRFASPQETAEILLDALPLEGVTRLAIDHLAVSPHLGVLASVDADLGYRVFMRDGLHQLGVAVCPVGRAEAGAPCLTILVAAAGQPVVTKNYAYGQYGILPVPAGSEVTIQPQPGFDVGAGRGQKVVFSGEESALGLIIDTRQRAQA